MKTLITTGQLFKFLELLKQFAMTPKRFQDILESGILSDVFDSGASLDTKHRDIWRIAMGIQSNVLTINCDKTLAEMISAGQYDWTNSDITEERFLVVGDGIEKVEFKLFHFDQTISSDEASRRIKADEWEDGEIQHLLSFGEKYPEEQRKIPIAALGSVVEIDGHHRVPVLERTDSDRDLDLRLLGNDLDWSYRFLAVRKIQAKVS